MMMWYFLLILAAAISGLLYFLGGESGWDTKVRDWGCNTIAIMLISAHGYQDQLTLFLSWCLMWWALTTYWKRKGVDARWWNWLLTGIGVGLSLTPIAVKTGNFFGLACYSILLGVFTSLWSEKNDDVRYEASGRGALIILLLPTFFLPSWLMALLAHR